jgi:hypothetical protein
LARSYYATWRQDPYLDRDDRGESFPQADDDDIFENDVDERYTQTTVQLEAYKRDMGLKRGTS